MQPKAIETRYKGYRFRSRLEARWAVFFDNMGIRYEYEPEGFVLDDGTYYLPDFRVKTPQGRIIWYEIKASEDAEGLDKVSKFNRMFLRNDSDPTYCYVLCGDPYELLVEKDRTVCPRCGLIHTAAYGHDFGKIFPHYGCEPCDFETPCGGDHPYDDSPWGATYSPHKGVLLITNETLPIYLKTVHYSATAARQARFEHGQTPS